MRRWRNPMCRSARTRHARAWRINPPWAGWTSRSRSSDEGTARPVAGEGRSAHPRHERRRLAARRLRRGAERVVPRDARRAPPRCLALARRTPIAGVRLGARRRRAVGQLDAHAGGHRRVRGAPEGGRRRADDRAEREAEHAHGDGGFRLLRERGEEVRHHVVPRRQRAGSHRRHHRLAAGVRRQLALWTDAMRAVDANARFIAPELLTGAGALWVGDAFGRYAEYAPAAIVRWIFNPSTATRSSTRTTPLARRTARTASTRGTSAIASSRRPAARRRTSRCTRRSGPTAPLR